jgi:hypothetical protein
MNSVKSLIFVFAFDKAAGGKPSALCGNTVSHLVDITGRFIILATQQILYQLAGSSCLNFWGMHLNSTIPFYAELSCSSCQSTRHNFFGVCKK